MGDTDPLSNAYCTEHDIYCCDICWPLRKETTMRTLTDHIVEGDSVNHQLKIEVQDGPGANGAHHHYMILLPLGTVRDIGTGINAWNIDFQNGPISVSGVNGLTHEALLAIIIDRLRSFQAGPFACRENSLALMNCEAALRALKERTEARIARGVEGTNVK